MHSPSRALHQRFTAAILLATGVLVAGASLAAGPTLSLLTPSYSNFQCRVTNTVKGGVDNLDALYDMHWADNGVSVEDPVGHVTWFLFGDTGDTECPFGGSCVGNAWYGSNGADAIAYINGSNYSASSGVCGGLGVATEPGQVSATGGAVFAPDLYTAPPGDAIGEYLYQAPVPPPSVPNNSSVLPAIASNQAISGTNEVQAGAFWYEGNMYVFSNGSPGRGITTDCIVGLPVPSVSFLARWANPTTPASPSYAPPNFQIISRIDYDLSDFTIALDYSVTHACEVTTCAVGFAPKEVVQTSGSDSGAAVCQCVGASGTGLTCSAATPPSGYVAPQPPGNWRLTSPFGAKFVWIAPVVGPDGYLYLFGTGQYRKTPVYVARLPLTYNGQDFPNFVAPYLADTPGLQFFDSSASSSWDSSPANATPLLFDTTTGVNANIGEIAVRWFNDVGAYVMSYNQTGTGNGPRVAFRWASSPTDTWKQLFPLDMSQAKNQCMYCSNANATTCSNNYGIAVPSPSAFTQCNPFSLYSPLLLPDISNESSAFSGGQQVLSFTVSFMYSTFVPYGAVLFTADMQVVNPNLIFADGFGG